MKTPAFWRALTVISVVLVLIIGGSQYIWQEVREVFGFALACILLFIIVNILAYFLGKRTAQNQNHSLFVQLVIAIIFLKMLLSVALVILYWNVVQPQSKVFILIFILIYLVYTIFEIYTLERLARLKPGDDQKT